MRKTVWMTIAAVGLALGAASAEAQYYGRGGGSDNAFRFRVGMFTPEGDSEYWLDNEAVFGGEPEDLEDVVLGADFRFGLGSRLGLVVSGDLFEGEDELAYLDIVDEFGNDIFHTTSLEVSAITAGLVLNLTPPDSQVVPYVGAGGGYYLWRLTEDGDFVDFADPLGPSIFTTTFEDEGEVLGWYWVAGLEVPIGPQWSLFAEGRWHNAEDELSGDFAGLGDLDLSGRQISGGASWRF